MILIKIVILYFIHIAHSDDFRSTFHIDSFICVETDIMMVCYPSMRFIKVTHHSVERNQESGNVYLSQNSNNHISHYTKSQLTPNVSENGKTPQKLQLRPNVIAFAGSV